MATQATIYDIESQILEATQAVDRAMDCIGIEMKLQGVDGALGSVYPENRAAWRAVFERAAVLKQKLSPLVSVLKVELE